MRVNKSFITDETGQRIAGSLRPLNEAVWGFSEMAPQVRSRVEALGQTRIASGNVVEGSGQMASIVDGGAVSTPKDPMVLHIRTTVGQV